MSERMNRRWFPDVRTALTRPRNSFKRIADTDMPVRRASSPIVRCADWGSKKLHPIA